MFWNGSTAIDGLSGSDSAGDVCGVASAGGLPSRPPADIAVATGAQSLNPTCTSGDFLKNPAQCCNLNRQIAVLDCKSRPRGLDQRIFGNRCSRPLQKQPKQRNRALAKHDRLGTAKQYLGVRVEAEWQIRASLSLAERISFGNILQLFRNEFTTCGAAGSCCGDCSA